MTDIAHLSHADINKETIELIRQKTKSKRNLMPINVQITKPVADIIARWSNQGGNKRDFVFPVINHDMDERKKRATIKQFTKMVNTYMRKIGSNLDIDADITTYTARHSYATILRDKGVNPFLIGEALGHSDIKTTERYFASFNNEARKDAANKLLEW